MSPTEFIGTPRRLNILPPVFVSLRPSDAFSAVAQTDNYDGTIFAYTKITWLQDPTGTLRSMLMDQAGFMSFDAFLKQCGSHMSQTHLRFWVEAQQILMTQGPQQVCTRPAVYPAQLITVNACCMCTIRDMFVHKCK